jgi:hypothetical protein
VGFGVGGVGVGGVGVVEQSGDDGFAVAVEGGAAIEIALRVPS